MVGDFGADGRTAQGGYPARTFSKNGEGSAGAHMSGIHISYKFFFGFDKILILFDLATGICRFRRKIFGNKDLVGSRGTRGTFAGFSRIAERAHMVSVCAFCRLGQGCTSQEAVF
jgi:hypothetical protein